MKSLPTSLCSLFFVLSFSLSAVGNLGHRLGGDFYTPENTLYSFKLALKNLSSKAMFHYAELDIQESKDGVAIVFHDMNKITRLVPKSKHNLDVLKRVMAIKKFRKITIADLNVSEIKGLILENGAKIPTLKEVLDTAVEWQLKKPILIEFKILRTDQCRNNTIKLVSQYRDKLDVNFLAFRKNYQASFPDDLRWAHQMHQHGLKTFTCCKPKLGIFNQSNILGKVGGKWVFSTLAERSLNIVDEKSRITQIPIKFKSVKSQNYALRIGIYHGYDNSGDKGLTFYVHTRKGKLVFSGSASDKSWKWMQTTKLPSNDLIITVHDKDTKLRGRFPGNSAQLKVNLVKL